MTKIYHMAECPICYETYEKTQVNLCLLLKCGHIFHERCVNRWVIEHSKCPMCKSLACTTTPLFLKDIIKERVQQGIEIAVRLNIAIMSTAVFTYKIVPTLVPTLLNAITPGHFPLVDEEEIGFYFKPERLFKLGISVFAITEMGCVFYILKSLKQRKNPPAHIAKRINYIPPLNP